MRAVLLRTIRFFESHLLPPHELTRKPTTQHFGQVIECCTQLLEKTTNQDEFIDLALDLCKFPEDRVAMCAMLDIEFIPLPPKDQAKVKPRKLVSQYT